MPVIFGVNEPQYTAEELEDFRLQNEEGVTVDGKHYTLYEATQRQRSLERSIRKRKHHILIDEELGDTEKLQQDQIHLQVLKQRYHEFSKAANLPEQYERMEKAGFTWKHGRAAEKYYTRKATAAPAGAIFVQKDDKLAINAKRVEPLEGFCDVVVHGDQRGFYMYDSNGNEYTYSPAEFAKIIQGSKNYTGGAIQLISCDTAAEDANSAQKLADILGVEIMAPTKAFFVDALGEMTIGSDPFTNDGDWVILKPKG